MHVAPVDAPNRAHLGAIGSSGAAGAPALRASGNGGSRTLDFPESTSAAAIAIAPPPARGVDRLGRRLAPREGEGGADGWLRSGLRLHAKQTAGCASAG